MWKVLKASVAGTSHAKTGKPCQDYCGYRRVVLGGEAYMVAACADGAGSASLSEYGALFAVDVVIEAAAHHLAATGLEAIGRDDVVGWFESALRQLRCEAYLLGVPDRELACTLLLAVLGPSRSIFAQIGDGAIVRRVGEQYVPVFWPQQGLYANMTNFITSADLPEQLDFHVEGAATETAIFTDGLQNLALAFATRTAHQPFFQRMFGQLEAVAAAEDLVVPLQAFLDSRVVNDRTDDDKSLMLILSGVAEAEAYDVSR